MTIEDKAKAYAGNKRRQLTTGQVVGLHIADLEDILCQAYLQGAKDAEKEYSDRVMQAIVLLEPNFEQTKMFKNIQNKIVAQAMAEINDKMNKS